MLGVALAVIAVALYFRWPMVADVWPWEGLLRAAHPCSPTSSLSSIAAAGRSAPTLWDCRDRQAARRRGRGHETSFLVSFTGIAIFMFQRVCCGPGQHPAARFPRWLLQPPASVLIVAHLPGRPEHAGLGHAAAARAGPRVVLRLHRGAPRSGGATGPQGAEHPALGKSALRVPVVDGWLFLGASVYFIYAVARPAWEMPTGPLLGFLAYDIVLILPFILGTSPGCSPSTCGASSSTRSWSCTARRSPSTTCSSTGAPGSPDRRGWCSFWVADGLVQSASPASLKSLIKTVIAGRRQTVMMTSSLNAATIPVRHTRRGWAARQ